MKKQFSALVGIILVAICYAVARLPTLTSREMAALAGRFSFKKLPLPEVTDHPPYKLVRQVHPSLERISAWISSLGAAATFADLDGDGFANDIIHVDPRTDLVTVVPAPGTGERYKPFALDSSAWSHGSYELSTIAPMGTLAGDFNEDGLPDVMVYFWGRTPVLYLRKSGGSPGSAVERGIPAEPLERRLFPVAFAAAEIVDSGERSETQ